MAECWLVIFSRGVEKGYVVRGFVLWMNPEKALWVMVLAREGWKGFEKYIGVSIS